MNDIENIEFEAMNDATKDIVGSNEKQDEKEEIKIPVVGADEINQQGGYSRQGKKREKYKQLTWEKYMEEQTEIFDNIEAAGKINATLTINSIPNEKEFHKLTTVLKDEYTPGATEYVIVETGWNSFYVMYKSTGLFDVVKALDGISSSFHFEKMGEHKIRIGESMQGVRAEKRLVLHISGQQKREIQRLLQDIKIPESNFGLMCCISTFNRAKEKFEGFITENYEAYYEDDGYMKIIKMEIDQATRNGIELLIDYLEVMFWEIESKVNEYLTNPYADSKLAKRIVYKRKAMNGAITALEKNKVEMSVKSQLLISSFRDDLEAIPLEN